MNANENKKQQTKKLGVLTILGYAVGFLFIPAGIVSVSTAGFLSGLFMVLAGMSVFPPLWKFVKNKYNYELTRSLKIMLFLILMAIGVASAGDGLELDDQTAPVKEPSNNTVTGNTTKESEKEEAPVVKEALILKGLGPMATEEFSLDKGLARFELTHDGGSNLIIELLDARSGSRVELLVNEIGLYDGSRAVRINRSGNYLLNIDADGSWTVNIK